MEIRFVNTINNVRYAKNARGGIFANMIMYVELVKNVKVAKYVTITYSVADARNVRELRYASMKHKELDVVSVLQSLPTSARNVIIHEETRSTRGSVHLVMSINSLTMSFQN
jgi:hypothetical protein